MYREGLAIASHLSIALKEGRAFRAIDRHEMEYLKRVEAPQGILWGAWKSLGKPNNNV
ncbi:hypothetical protein [Sinorhizobium fredii]|uniref:hypothetical protein n=1 Tax=Rhizobium fredii TaxID=380 RepID=UPI0013E8B548|nr:hypothetical protein [Sinorhizobium fredii]